MNDFRKLAQKLASLAHADLAELDKDYLPLDGDETNDLAMKFEEELNKLNGNT